MDVRNIKRIYKSRGHITKIEGIEKLPEVKMNQVSKNYLRKTGVDTIG